VTKDGHNCNCPGLRPLSVSEILITSGSVLIFCGTVSNTIVDISFIHFVLLVRASLLRLGCTGTRDGDSKAVRM
jgi:hypothetical protein